MDGMSSLAASPTQGGIAFINNLGLIGGIVSPFLLGWIKTTAGSLTLGFHIMAGIMIAGGWPCSSPYRPSFSTSIRKRSERDSRFGRRLSRESRSRTR
jgi:hypothetical protein